ncbi:hypothetical protein E2C01_012676 [Portunus trituberculatus]|uniref:Uncharacterized protein n=1 Tax=Portunus trituberculatus TaxID=210409 RepID=A0A5B7DEC2_PORTR|nr:hypothetical protein [Portunus trituberculatus]
MVATRSRERDTTWAARRPKPLDGVEKGNVGQKRSVSPRGPQCRLAAEEGALLSTLPTATWHSRLPLRQAETFTCTEENLDHHHMLFKAKLRQGTTLISSRNLIKVK